MTMVLGYRKQMICIECLVRIHATIPQAKKHGWTVWVGGARCKSCTEKNTNSSISSDKSI
jgi:dissimilatory sulfite reductase (desulfoviridin) alpha/beta subunit